MSNNIKHLLCSGDKEMVMLGLAALSERIRHLHGVENIIHAVEDACDVEMLRDSEEDNTHRFRGMLCQGTIRDTDAIYSVRRGLGLMIISCLPGDAVAIYVLIAEP